MEVGAAPLLAQCVRALQLTRAPEFACCWTDGDLDLVFANYGGNGGWGGNYVYVNDGTGQFTQDENSAVRNTHPTDGSDQVVLADLTGDGHLDVYIGNSWSTHPNRLYVNNGDGTFAEDSDVAFGVTGAGTSVDIADVDNVCASLLLKPFPRPC